ncbi:MAG: hypothetical protein GYA55_15110 [SAR324 cluster bacterium]|uniref:Uncharacterized protein n=1 Tax=SAR324 cluster bacterium TaxID=2024889 RepID=A0A7X9FUE3_9DELT|nr:hypothetical protein [SAR324 cluster bacterium]
MNSETKVEISTRPEGRDLTLGVGEASPSILSVLPDEAFIKSLRNGDESAFEALHARYPEEKERIEIAKIAAVEDGEGTSEYIENYGIKDKQALIEIAKIAAAKSGVGTSMFIQNYGIKDKQVLIEIAKIAAAQSGGGTSECIQNYGIKDKKALIEIALIALRGNASGTLVYLDRYNLDFLDYQTLTSFLVDDLFNNPGTIASLSQTLKQLALALPTLLSNPKLKDLSVANRLEALCALPCEHSEVCSRISKAFSSEVKTEDEVCAILATLIAHAKDLPEGLEGRALSRFALQKASGLDSILIPEDLSTNGARNLYAVLLDVGIYFDSRLSSFITIEPECWSKGSREKTLEALLLLKALHSLGGKREGVLLSQDSLSKVVSELSSDLAKSFEKKLDLNKASVSSDAVLELQRLWGDLMPIIVLYGRLSANPSWTAALPVVREAILRCLLGDFEDYKYESSEQLPFEPGVIRAWRQNPSSLRFVEAENPLTLSEEERFEAACQIVKSNLITHLQGSEFHDWAFAPILDEVSSLSKLQKEARPAALFRMLIEERKDPKRFLEALKELQSRGQEFNLPKELREDLLAISRVLDPPRNKAAKSNVIFSVVTDDPKLLLTVGDLVDTASCQNYRTGSYIQTLPGYVVDGNIKVALSFVIPVHEIEELLSGFEEALKEGRLHYLFDAPKLKLKLYIEGGESIEFHLKRAMRRHILRLGSKDNGPAILCERGYVQNHGIEKEIEKALKDLVETFRLSCGAIEAPPGTQFPASRNPCGVYSDSCGGIMEGRYESPEFVN